MKKIYLFFVSLFILCAVRSQTVDDQAVYNGVWWYGSSNPSAQAPLYNNGSTAVIGNFASFRWSDIQPSAPPANFNWSGFDQKLTNYANDGKYICIIIWTGVDAPISWLQTHGVGTFMTDDADMPGPYPDYKDPDYINYWYAMISTVITHLNTLSSTIRSKVIILQSAEGTTGDVGPYKGNPLGGYTLNTQTWRDIRTNAWIYTNTQINSYNGNPGNKIHLLVNIGNESNDYSYYLNWFSLQSGTIVNAWRKAGNPGHGYQLNNEASLKAAYDPLINTPQTGYPCNTTKTRARSELSQEPDAGWFTENPKWNYYWLSLQCLQFGLDIWMLPASDILNPDSWTGLNFYQAYAGYKDADCIPSAFCALRDGLDASDFTRFPPGTYQNGTINNYIPRANAIIASFSSYGALQEDAASAQGNGISQRNATGLNDVGWNIYPGNYEKFVTQINLPTALYRGGYWRKGNAAQVCGRFAKGFDNAHSLNDMYFDIDNNLFSVADGGAATHNIYMYITYLYQGSGQNWQLTCYKKGSGGSSFSKTFNLSDFTNDNTFNANPQVGDWARAYLLINNCYFTNNITVSGGSPADLVLHNPDPANGDDIFHMLEISKNAPPQSVRSANNNIISSAIVNGLSVFPNPSRDNFTISTNNRLVLLSISIYNESGQIVLNKKANGSVINISKNETGIKKGIYYIIATGTNNQKFTGTVKIVD